MNKQAPDTEVIKAITTDPISAQMTLQQMGSNVAAADAVAWPLDQDAILMLYMRSPEHARCCQIKAEGAFGAGIEGADANKLEQLIGGAADFFTRIGLDLTVFGNAFVQLIHASGEVVAMRQLPARTMYRHLDGKQFVQIIYDVRGMRTTTRFDAQEIIHLRQPCPAALWYALPSWYAATSMIELYDEACKFNAAFFANGAVPEMAVVFKGFAPDAAAKTSVRDFFTNNYKGTANAHRTLVTHISDGQSIEFKELTRAPKDGDFIKLLDAAKERIPIAHGVPPRMLGIVSAGQLGGGGENEGQTHSFNEFALKPMRRGMLDQLRPTLAAAGINDVTFKAIDLIPQQNDKIEMANLVAAGVLKIPEARRQLGLKKSTAEQSTTEKLAQILAEL